MQSGRIGTLSQHARAAIQRADWPSVGRCADEILRIDGGSAEGWFLRGWHQKAGNQPRHASASFEQAVELDPERYDAAIELANQLCLAHRNSEAKALLDRYAPSLENSPRYLDMAGTNYVELGLSELAWPLYVRANELQPGIDLFQGNLASCAVYLGKFDQAERIYRDLLKKHPYHRRNHYRLSRLRRAKDLSHITEMRAVLASTGLPDDKNIFLLYAIGKEFEDLERWSEAFSHYRRGGDAVASVSNYQVETDVAIVDKLMEIGTSDWLAQPGATPAVELHSQPIFVCGLPRTGTTLTERILASHSQVQSIDETQYIDFALRQASGVETTDRFNLEIIEAARDIDPPLLARSYMEFVDYLIGDEPWFIDKLPYNYLFLGFIARAFPEARLVHLRRHPLDACFAMYKQVFTWAYKFSYTLSDLADYYIAYDRLMNHWRQVLGHRLIEVRYEELASDFEAQTRSLLDRLGLPFEASCLEFEKNERASTTASSVQVREKVHARSIDRWKHFEEELQPLADRLTQAGIDL